MHISSSYLLLFYPLWCKHAAMCQNSNQMCAPEATQRSGNFFASLICCNSMQYCYSSVQSHFICKQMMIIQTEVYFWEISKCTCMKCCLLTHGGVKQVLYEQVYKIFGCFFEFWEVLTLEIPFLGQYPYHICPLSNFV